MFRKIEIKWLNKERMSTFEMKFWRKVGNKSKSRMNVINVQTDADLYEITLNLYVFLFTFIFFLFFIVSHLLIVCCTVYRKGAVKLNDIIKWKTEIIFSVKWRMRRTCLTLFWMIKLWTWTATQSLQFERRFKACVK